MKKHIVLCCVVLPRLQTFHMVSGNGDENLCNVFPTLLKNLRRIFYFPHQYKLIGMVIFGCSAQHSGDLSLKNGSNTYLTLAKNSMFSYVSQ